LYFDAYASPDLPLNHQGRLSYTAGFRLGRTFGQHFSATAGLQYSRIRENLYLDSGEAIKVYLKTLDIPLLAGYTMDLGNIKTTITGGIIVNIRSWNKLGPNFIGTDYYKTNTGLSLYLGLNYTQPLIKKLSLFAEPYLRYRLTEMTERGPFFPEKIHVAGLSLGLRYGF